MLDTEELNTWTNYRAWLKEGVFASYIARPDYPRSEAPFMAIPQVQGDAVSPMIHKLSGGAEEVPTVLMGLMVDFYTSASACQHMAGTFRGLFPEPVWAAMGVVFDAARLTQRGAAAAGAPARRPVMPLPRGRERPREGDDEEDGDRVLNHERDVPRERERGNPAGPADALYDNPEGGDIVEEDEYQNQTTTVMSVSEWMGAVFDISEEHQPLLKTIVPHLDTFIRRLVPTLSPTDRVKFARDAIHAYHNLATASAAYESLMIQLLQQYNKEELTIETLTAMAVLPGEIHVVRLSHLNDVEKLLLCCFMRVSTTLPAIKARLAAGIDWPFDALIMRAYIEVKTGSAIFTKAGLPTASTFFQNPLVLVERDQAGEKVTMKFKFMRIPQIHLPANVCVAQHVLIDHVVSGMTTDFMQPYDWHDGQLAHNPDARKSCYGVLLGPMEVGRTYPADLAISEQVLTESDRGILKTINRSPRMREFEDAVVGLNPEMAKRYTFNPTLLDIEHRADSAMPRIVCAGTTRWPSVIPDANLRLIVQHGAILHPNRGHMKTLDSEQIRYLKGFAISRDVQITDY